MPESDAGSVAAGPPGLDRGSPPPSDRQKLEHSLGRLRERARPFARLPPADKARLLRQVRARFFELSEAMVEVANRHKGVEPSSAVAGEEWFSGPAISLRALRLFELALSDVAEHGAPRIAARDVERTADGRTRVVLVPHDLYDRALFPGWRVTAWLEPGVFPARISEVQASFYRKAEPEGHVVLVLGAGNVGSISVLDVLYHSFVEGAVCLLKMSPVNAYLGPFFERAFAPLIEAGYLAIVYGGGDVGGYLSSHPAVDAIHVTGSVETHDTIVWGPAGPERERRRKALEPLTRKRITSELGNVSPVLVVPARYSEREIEAAARSIVGMVVQNASFNCNAAKMIVTARGWPQRAALLGRIREVFREEPSRFAYYPGAQDRYDSLRTAAQGGQVDSIGDSGAGKLPWTLVSGLDAAQESKLFQVEPFCSIVSECMVAADDAPEFLVEATRFANERLWGTLNAMLIAPSSVERDSTLRAALTKSVSDLRYGTVGVNVWPAAGYGLASPPWGGYPGATLADVQSGIGWGHDAAMLEHVEKSVLEGPLLGLLEPLWNPGHAHLRELGRALSGIEAAPSLSGVLRAAWADLRR
ncbi:MAG TPA: aldehyde dehydrogenase family protein [Polyangiaceae bacterium]|nr:aldehyde dehydrogenase family protein [Polyangiaceae bacterium]